MEITYDDYKLAIINAGEDKLMDLSYHWDRKLFNKDYNKQLINDKSINSRKLLAIMVIANSYLNTNLFVGLLKHPNVDASIAGYWINYGTLNGDIIRTKFYLSMIERHSDIVSDSFVNKALKQHDTAILVAMLKNKIMADRLSDHKKLELLRTNSENSKFTDRIKGTAHLEDLFVKLYEQYHIDIYLPDSVKDIFLF